MFVKLSMDDSFHTDSHRCTTLHNHASTLGLLCISFFHPRSTASLRFTRFALCHRSIAKQQSLSFQSHAFWVKTIQCALVPEAEILADVKVPWLILAVQICTVFFFT
jgi:hypothetical protein